MIQILLTGCQDVGFLRIIYFIKKIIGIAFIIIPIILIVMMLIDFSKNVMASSADEMKKNTNMSIKRVVYCIFAFFVPTIVNVVMNIVYDNANVDGSPLECYYNATLDKIKELKNQELYTAPNRQNKVQKDKTPGSLGTNSSNSSSDSSSEVNSNSSVDHYTIYVGDSRTVGMCQTLNLSENEECVAKIGEGYRWFYREAIDMIKRKIKEKGNADIYINLGTNDLSNIDKYIEKYKTLTSTFEGSTIHIISVGPVDEVKEKSNGYSVKNSSINDFNSKLENGLSGSGIKYCNINSNIDYVTTDGVHYDSTTYKKIYEEMKKCL